MGHVLFDNIWNTYGILFMMNYLRLEFMGNAQVTVTIICKFSPILRVPKIDFGHPEIPS